MLRYVSRSHDANNTKKVKIETNPEMPAARYSFTSVKSAMLPANGETGAAVGLCVVVCVVVVVVFVRVVTVVVVELVVVDAVSAVKIWSPYSKAIMPAYSRVSTVVARCQR